MYIRLALKIRWKVKLGKRKCKQSESKNGFESKSELASVTFIKVLEHINNSKRFQKTQIIEILNK